MPVFNWAWFIDRSRCDGVLTYMKCSTMMWAAFAKALLTCLWRSWRRSNNFWFAPLKKSSWKLCFAVALYWGFKYFLRKTARTSPRFSRIRPSLLLNVCKVSPLLGFDSVISSQMVVDFKACLKNVFEHANSLHFPSNVGLVVVSDFGILEIWWKLLINFAELIFLPIAEGLTNVYLLQPLQGCSFAEMRLTCRTSFLLFAWGGSMAPVYIFFVKSCHRVKSVIWARVWCRLTLSLLQDEGPSGSRTQLFPALCLVCFWTSLERFRIGPWFVLGLFRDDSGAVQEWPWLFGFRRKSLRWDSAP